MRAWMLALAAVLSGCSATECTARSETIDILYPGFESPGVLETGWLEEVVRIGILQNSGWSCAEDATILNADGATIGERWLCTTCE